jgi:hypothetical protein
MLSFVQQHPVLAFGLLIAFSVVARTMAGGVFGSPARRHGAVVVEYVLKHGYQLLNPVLAQKLDESLLAMVNDPSVRDLARATSDIADVGMFGDGNDDWLAFRCELGSKQVTIFNFSQAPPLHGGSGPVSYRVAKIRVDGLPRFSLEPRSVVTSVETLTGKLLHQPDSTIELAPASFDARYRLKGPDRGAVTDWFTSERMQFIEVERLPGSLASNAHYLVYWESTAMRTEADYDAFVAVVERVAMRFL